MGTFASAATETQAQPEGVAARQEAHDEGSHKGNGFPKDKVKKDEGKGKGKDKGEGKDKGKDKGKGKDKDKDKDKDKSKKEKGEPKKDKGAEKSKRNGNEHKSKAHRDSEEPMREDSESESDHDKGTRKTKRDSSGDKSKRQGKKESHSNSTKRKDGVKEKRRLTGSLYVTEVTTKDHPATFANVCKRHLPVGVISGCSVPVQRDDDTWVFYVASWKEDHAALWSMLGGFITKGSAFAAGPVPPVCFDTSTGLKLLEACAIPEADLVAPSKRTKGPRSKRPPKKHGGHKSRAKSSDGARAPLKKKHKSEDRTEESAGPYVDVEADEGDADGPRAPSSTVASPAKGSVRGADIGKGSKTEVGTDGPPCQTKDADTAAAGAGAGAGAGVVNGVGHGKEESTEKDWDADDDDDGEERSKKPTSDDDHSEDGGEDWERGDGAGEEEKKEGEADEGGAEEEEEEEEDEDS